MYGVAWYQPSCHLDTIHAPCYLLSLLLRVTCNFPTSGYLSPPITYAVSAMFIFSHRVLFVIETEFFYIVLVTGFMGYVSSVCSGVPDQVLDAWIMSWMQ